MNKLKSRKFWMAVLTALLIILNDGLGLDIPNESLISIVGIVVAYIAGESYIDSKKRGN